MIMTKAPLFTLLLISLLFIGCNSNKIAFTYENANGETVTEYVDPEQVKINKDRLKELQDERNN